MAFSIRLTEQEKKIVDSYARLHSISLGEAFKQALFEKIEEEYDLAVFDDAYDEYKKSGEESRPISDFWKELDIILTSLYSTLYYIIISLSMNFIR